MAAAALEPMQKPDKYTNDESTKQWQAYCCQVNKSALVWACLKRRRSYAIFYRFKIFKDKRDIGWKAGIKHMLEKHLYLVWMSWVSYLEKTHRDTGRTCEYNITTYKHTQVMDSCSHWQDSLQITFFQPNFLLFEMITWENCKIK